MIDKTNKPRKNAHMRAPLALWVKKSLFLCLLIMVLPMTAVAEQTISGEPTLLLKKYAPSHPEHILMAFHKKANLVPDYLEWAKKSPFLEKTKEMDRDAVISREDNRLRKAFSEFDTSNPLIVHTSIQMNNYSTLQEVMQISEFSPKTFFSYNLYGENVAVIPKGVSNFSKLNIAKETMETMLSKARNSNIVAEFLLKPSLADAKEPFLHNDISYWLMLADIAELRFWSQGDQPELLWSYRADWYQPKEDTRLLDLKSGGIE